MNSPETLPWLAHDDIDRLRDGFGSAGYTVDAAGDAIGPQGRSSLARNHSIAADRAIGSRVDPLATLIRLFVLQQPVAAEAVARALPVPPLLSAGILARDDDSFRATLDIRPYDSPDDGASGWLVSDHAATLDTARATARPDHVLGVSPASTTLAQLTIRNPVARALDLGTGCGVQTLHLARHAETVVATDLNPRAVMCAELSLALSGVEADLRVGSLYDPVPDETFDLVVTNPPFVMSPPEKSRLTYREGGFDADGLMQAVVTQGIGHLAPGGVLQVLGNWAHLQDQPWPDRLSAWLDDASVPCDVLVLEREVLDPYEYVEIWLADAGLAGSAEYDTRYREWVDYFDRLGIEAVGMGWLTIRRTARPPQRRFESWPHAVQQPVGPLLGRWLDDIAPSQASDVEILDACWRLSPYVSQETIGEPGAADPTHVVLRQQTGLCRAVEVDTALGGVVGACDGTLALGQIIGAVAGILDLSADALTGDLLPRFRRLVADSWFERDA